MTCFCSLLYPYLLLLPTTPLFVCAIYKDDDDDVDVDEMMMMMIIIVIDVS